MKIYRSQRWGSAVDSGDILNFHGSVDKIRLVFILWKRPKIVLFWEVTTSVRCLIKNYLNYGGKCEKWQNTILRGEVQWLILRLQYNTVFIATPVYRVRPSYCFLNCGACNKKQTWRTYWLNLIPNNCAFHDL